MLTGVIAKQEGPYWSAVCDAVGAYTQGRSRKEAAAMLAEVVELRVGELGVARKEFAATVTEMGTVGERQYSVLIEANEPGLLIAAVLDYQRDRHRLTRAEVVEKLGDVSLDAYTAYEQGKREPTLSQLRELLAAVAPDLALTVGPRATGKQKRSSRRGSKRRSVA